MEFELGSSFLAASLLLTTYAAALFYTGSSRRDTELLNAGEKAAVLSAICLTFSAFTLFYYLLADNYSVEYVFLNSNTDMALQYKISAFWAGSEGSMMLWVWIVSLLIVAFIRIERKDILTAYSAFIALIVNVFLLSTLILFLNPFKIMDFSPPHGMGLNPLLETHEMVFHPPALFMGYAAVTIPFALSIAGVYLVDDRWVFRARKWILFSWLWLSVGIAVGAFWAYRVLGWGGFWGWDPVENASLLPWLTVTALLHSIMIQEARQGMKLWNVVLAFASFEFVMLGTFLTRSGVVGSVHAFGKSGLSAPFTFFMAATLLATLMLLKRRRKLIMSRDVVESAVSKEATFLMNNMLFTAFALTVLGGTLFPILNEAIVGYKATVGEKYYLQVLTPVAFSLIALIGLCVGLGWRRSDERTVKRLFAAFATSFIAAAILGYTVGAEVVGVVAASLAIFSIVLHVLQYLKDTAAFKRELENLSYLKIILRKRRRYGGYTAHLGVILIFLGVVGNWVYAEEYKVELKMNEPVRVGDITLTYRGLVMENSTLKVSRHIVVDVASDSFHTLTPQQEYYLLRGQDVTRVAILHEFLRDIYVIPEMADEGAALLKVRFNPLTDLIWVGVVVMLVGGTISLIPRRIVYSEEG